GSRRGRSGKIKRRRRAEGHSGAPRQQYRQGIHRLLIVVLILSLLACCHCCFLLRILCFFLVSSNSSRSSNSSGSGRLKQLLALVVVAQQIVVVGGASGRARFLLLHVAKLVRNGPHVHARVGRGPRCRSAVQRNACRSSLCQRQGRQWKHSAPGAATA